MVTVILCVFLLSYMYGEGKSNYFSESSRNYFQASENLTDLAQRAVYWC